MKNGAADKPRAIEGICSPRKPGSYVVLYDNSVAEVHQLSTSVGGTSKIPGSKRARRPVPY